MVKPYEKYRKNGIIKTSPVPENPEKKKSVALNGEIIKLMYPHFQMCSMDYWLVVEPPTPLKNMSYAFVSWDDMTFPTVIWKAIKFPWFQSPPTRCSMSNRFSHGSVFPMGKIPWKRTLGGIATLTKTQEEGPVGPERSVKLGSSQIDSK